MSLQYFDPWVGENYKSGDIFKGKKVMILGESHYGYEDMHLEEQRKATVETVTRYLSNIESKGPELWRKTFDRIVKIGLNKSTIIKDDIKKFWESIIFYNYVTESMYKVDGGFARPTKEQWEKSGQPFLNILTKYSPDYMLVCGSQLWWNLPWIGEDGPLEYYWYFPTSKNTKCLATFIKHPSRFMVGINSKPSKEIFQKLISYESI